MHDDNEWAKRKSIVDSHNVQNAQSGHLGYWDHLSTDEWMLTFNNQFKEQLYKRDFNHVYADYLEQIRAFIRSVYPLDVRANQLCAVLLYWHIATTLEAAFFLT